MVPFLGTAYYNASTYKKAEGYYRHALYYNGESFHANVNLAASLVEQGRAKDGLDYSIYAQMFRPDNPLANAQLGINYFHLNEDEKALPYLNRAKRIDPGHFTHPQMYLAKIYLRTGCRPSVLRELEDLLRRHPSMPAAVEVRKRAERLKRAIASTK